MLHSNGSGRFQGIGAVLGPEARLRGAVEALARQIVFQDDGCQPQVIDEIVALGMQPEVLEALRQREDPQEAVRDLATRHAFAQLMVGGRPFHDLDPLSQALVQQTLDLIYQRADQVTRRTGEDPLDADPGLLLSICRSLSRYVPKKPMGAHISWKLQHYEGAVSRAMRQIQHLVTRPKVTEPFVAFVLETGFPDTLKAQLLQLARGGGRRGLNYEAVIRFFALPETLAFVQRFANTVQTARTFYDDEVYEGIEWLGPRRLPKGRRQSYLEAALASLERRYQVSLDVDRWDLHDLLER